MTNRAYTKVILEGDLYRQKVMSRKERDTINYLAEYRLFSWRYM